MTENERIAVLETRQGVLEQTQHDQSGLITNLDHKIDKLVEQVSAIKVSLIVIAVAAGLSVPWESKLALIQAVLKHAYYISTSF